MQIIHTVQATPEEAKALFDLAALCGEIKESTAYDPEEKVRLMAQQNAEFKKLLAAYIHEAFAYGYGAGGNSASAKDTLMYNPANS
jgi:hypothetical protein